MAIKPLNSVAGFSVGETPANIILANGDITTANLTLTGKANLNTIGNVIITGGSSGQVIQTDGSGNLTFATISTSSLSNGNSNISVLANANVTISSAGNANVIVVTGTGANIAGTLSVTGNANVGNLGTTGQLISSVSTGTAPLVVSSTTVVANLAATTAGTVTASAQPAITSLGTLSSLTVTANVAAGNLTTGGVVDATGNVIGGNITTVGVVAATGNVSGGNITTVGVVAATGNVSGGNITTLGNVTGAYILGNGSQLTGLVTDSISNGTSNVSIASVNGNITLSSAGNANVLVVTGTGSNIAGTLNVSGTASLPNIISTATDGNITFAPNGSGVVVIAGTEGGAVGIEMGTPTQGALISNAVTMTTATSVTNGIALLNNILGKLVPPSPPTFPNGTTLVIQSLSTYRMTNFTQTDNTPGANKSVAAGTTVTTTRRASSYTTNTISTVGPGDSGTVSARLNGANAGGVTLTGASNGTYGNLVISLNQDYNVSNASIAAGFWYVFSAGLSGTVTQGWNEVYIADTAAGNTNTANWYYDASAPGTPTFSSITFAPGTPSLTYTSTVPHYNSSSTFSAGFLVNKLSGDMYPTTDTFVTGSAGGAFAAPTSVTYTTAGVTTPLARNLYVSSGNATVATTTTVIAGFGSSSSNCTVAVTNSYLTGTGQLNPGAIVLYKTGTVSSATRIEEANVFIASTIGSGTGLAFRIVNPGSTSTPTYSASAAAFDSQSGTLQNYDATVVANILKHDQTNYSTGYLPAGPNLSSGRTGTQYFTFKLIRTSVSKFDVKWSGTLAGLWVALPGSTIDTSSTLNGWLDMSVAYAGAGAPGAGTGGNGSNGCALGGVAPLNAAQTNKAVTATFGTVSSSSTATNEIYVRIALTSGQTVTALSLQTASN